MEGEKQVTLLDSIATSVKSLYENCTYEPGNERLAYLDALRDVLNIVVAHEEFIKREKEIEYE